LNGTPFEYGLYNQDAIVHKLSHQHLHTKFWIVEVDALREEGIFISEIQKFPTPILIGNFIDDFRFPL